MATKFENVPVEADTKVLFQEEAKFGQYDILYQKWYWDGITAESIIFVSEDVAELTDDQLEEDVKTSPLVKTDSSVTISRSASGFTFVNFNFEVD